MRKLYAVLFNGSRKTQQLYKPQYAICSLEFDLMELLDVGLKEVISAVARISEIVCPPYQTVSVFPHIKLLKCLLTNKPLKHTGLL